MSRAVPPTDDAPIPGMTYFLISMASPHSEKLKGPCNMFKVKYVCGSIEEARKTAATMRNEDDDFDVYVGPIGKWVPFIDNPLLVQDTEYQEATLNELVREHRRLQRENNAQFAQRVNAETERIMQSNANRTNSDSEVEVSLNNAISMRYKIYALDKKLVSLQEQRDTLWTQYTTTFSEEDRRMAEEADMPRIDDVAPERITVLPDSDSSPSTSQ